MPSFNRNYNGNFTKDSSFYSIYYGGNTYLTEDNLNEAQWNIIERIASNNRNQFSSGFLSKFSINTTSYDNVFTISNNESGQPMSLLIDGYDLTIGGNSISNQPSDLISSDDTVIFQLPNASSSPRTDLIILEAWFEVITFFDTVRKYGGDTTINLTNNINDARYSQEISRRIQFRWRIRTVSNQTNILNVNAVRYDGTDTGIKYSTLNDVYAIDLGNVTLPDGSLKTNGRIYGLPLFAVSRPANNNKITISQITDLSLKSYSISASTLGSSDSIPTAGTWGQGTIVYNSNPQPGGFVGWICTRDGVAAQTWSPTLVPTANVTTVIPTVDNGYYYTCVSTANPAAAASTEPMWPMTSGSTVTDTAGNVWKQSGTAALFKPFGPISE